MAGVESVLHDSSWPVGTVVIGGVDALTKAEYRNLCDGADTRVDTRNAPDRVHDNEWINCGVTWVKAASGNVSRWLQPKLEPSWPERNITHARMFSGNSVFIYRAAFANGLPCRFLSLMCFDWVGIRGGQPIRDKILDQLNARGEEISLSWIFVLEHNEEPSHPSFLFGAADLFENQAHFPLVNRGRAGLIFANTAGGPVPGKVARYGSSSVVFSPLAPFDLRGCNPTYSSVPQTLRANPTLARCKDIVFREMGACIHSFSQNIPAAAHLGSHGRDLPIRRARVHSIAAATVDPRTGGTEVPAPVKWVNDTLDAVPCLSHQIPAATLAPSIGAPHQLNVKDFRVVSSAELQRRLEQATSRPEESEAPDADHWDQDEKTALTHLVHSLDILRTGGAAIDLSTTLSHAAVTLRNHEMELLAISGSSHDDCLKHAEHRFIVPSRCSVLLVTRDVHNSPRLKKHGSILHKASGALNTETKITDADSGMIHVAFRDLLDPYVSADTTSVLGDSLYARLQ